jgi:hypothetical protein
MPSTEITYDQGNCTSKDKIDLGKGEMQVSTGAYYKPGDPKRIWKIGGRSAFGDTGSAAKIIGAQLCLFDTGGTDRIVCQSGTTLYKATPGATGTWSSLATGLSSSATDMFAVHNNDRWYLTNGYDAMRAFENDGTVRNAGMVAPARPTATNSVGTAGARFTASTGSGFTNPANAYDSSVSTYAYARLSAAGTSTTTWTTMGAATGAGRTLQVIVAVSSPTADQIDRGQFGIGGAALASWNVTAKVEKSEDGGSTFPVTIFNHTFTSSRYMQSQKPIQVAVTANNNLVQIRATFTYNSGTVPAEMRLYDAVVGVGGNNGSVTTTTGMYYSVTEYDQVRGLEGPPCDPLFVQLAAQNTVTLTLAGAGVNSNATHYRIYRTPDGGTAPYQLGLIGTIPITETAFVDDLAFAITYQPTPLVPMSQITVDTGSIRVIRDMPPPILSKTVWFRGSLVGIAGTRAIAWCEPGFPESWPVINVNDKFPMPEHDQLVSLESLGDVLIIGAQAVMLILTDIPRVVNGVYNNAEVVPLRGQPGCVGTKAMTSFSVHGEPLAAWVSPYGVHVTNGQTSSRISDDMDWTATVSTANLSSAVLHYRQDLQILVFAYDSTGGGTNDRIIYFHMNNIHRKQNNLPKWTGPHYGKIACMTSGQISSVYRIYSGHTTNGIVYLEDSGTTDASQAYSSTTVPMILTPGRISEDKYVEVVRGSLQHTNAGSTQTISLAWTSMGDKGSTDDTYTQAISLSSDDNDDVWIAMAGQQHEHTWTHTGAASFGLSGFTIWSRETGDVGRVLTS